MVALYSHVFPNWIYAQFCNTKFGFTLLDIHVVSPLICSQNVFRRLDSGVAATSGALLELIFIRNNMMSISLGLDLDDVFSFIHFYVLHIRLHDKYM